MKKTAIAIFTLTGILLAGCSAEPTISLTEQPSAAITEEAKGNAPDDERISLSDSKTNIGTAEPTLSTEKVEDASPSVQPKKEESNEAPSTPNEKTKGEAKATKASETAPKVKANDTPKATAKPVADTEAKIVIPSAEPEKSEPAKTEPTPQPEKPAPTVEPTPEPQPEPEVMGGGFNSDVLAAINEARALHGNAAMSLDGGLCSQALEHAKEMARQGKRFHSCGGVESVSDSSGSARTIGARSAVHASDLELNAGLTSLGVGSVKTNGKQYTCVIGR